MNPLEFLQKKVDGMLQVFTPEELQQMHREDVSRRNTNQSRQADRTDPGAIKRRTKFKGQQAPNIPTHSPPGPNDFLYGPKVQTPYENPSVKQGPKPPPAQGPKPGPKPTTPASNSRLKLAQGPVPPKPTAPPQAAQSFLSGKLKRIPIVGGLFTAAEAGLDVADGENPLYAGGRALAGALTGTVTAGGAAFVGAEPQAPFASMITVNAGYNNGYQLGTEQFDRFFGQHSTKGKPKKESGRLPMIPLLVKVRRATKSAVKLISPLGQDLSKM